MAKMQVMRQATAMFGALAPAMGLSMVLAGCGSKSQTGSMSGAINDYQSASYGEAQHAASQVMQSSQGEERAKAAYVAGLSAYQAGNFDEAEIDLSTAANSSDPEVAGSAKAMLGQVRLDQHRPREAATYFAEASQLLTGEDARQAAWHAGLANREAGNEAAAKHWLEVAGRTPTATAQANTAPAATSGQNRTSSNVVMGGKPASPASSSNSSSSKGSASTPAAPETVGFTLQVGAFTDKHRAKKAAEEAQTLAQSQSLGRVRVIPRRDARGQAQYLVQVGWWVTRNEAAAARAKVGRLEYIVAPATPVS